MVIVRLSDNMCDDNYEKDVDFNSSILNYSIQKILSYDIADLRKVFLDEVRDLENHDLDYKLMWFDKLFALKKEYNIYFNLISSLSSIDTDFLQSNLSEISLAHKDRSEECGVLLKVLDFYENHSKYEIEKFNYLYKSSVGIDYGLTYDNFDLFFNSRIFNLFDKETLCHLYREFFALKKDCLLFDFLKEENHKALYMLSIMGMKLKAKVGHNNQIFNFCFSSNNFDNYIKLLNSMYDYYVGSNAREDEFRDKYLNNNYFDIDEAIAELCRVVIDSSCSYSVITDRDMYYELKLSERRNRHTRFLEIKSIENENDLSELKNIYFLNIYGISYDDALSFTKSYGYLDALDKDIMEKDRDIYNVLKSIHNICNININDKEKILAFQREYYNYFLEKGVDYIKESYSYFILESMFNKMIINTYNKKLLKVENSNFIGEINGVKVFDSGLNFDIILTSLGGVREINNENTDNKKYIWNTALYANNHAISCSHINNEYLGVIHLDSVFIGFDYLPEYSLHRMGPYDIYSPFGSFDMKNHYFYSGGKKYYPVSILPNETRSAYNEVLIERFLMDDKENRLKLQPSYVVYYALNDDFSDDDNFKNSLKVAKDFDVPVIVVDIKKIKANEKRIIEEKEMELFSKEECNFSLMKDIIVRYINNYAGSSVLTKSGYSDVDFSEEGLSKFYDKFFDKLDSLSAEEQTKWCQFLLEVFYIELEKYHRLESDSPLEEETWFPLNDLNARILKSRKMDFYNLSFGKSDFTECVKTAIDFINHLNTEQRFDYTINGDLVLMNCFLSRDSDTELINDLLVSYFFESKYLVSDLSISKFKHNFIKFSNQDNFDFIDCINKSVSYGWTYFDEGKIVNEKKLNLVLDKLDDISDEQFLRIFGNTINEYSSYSKKRFEDVCCNLLDKKKNARSEFNRLINYLSEKNIGNKRM